MSYSPYYLVSQDAAHYPPVSDNAPTIFVGVANPASLHALSYLSDRTRVDGCIFFDTNPLQIEFHRRQTEIAGIALTPLQYIEEISGVKFLPEFHDDPDLSKTQSIWESADVSRFEATTNITLVRKERYGLVIPRFKLMPKRRKKKHTNRYLPSRHAFCLWDRIWTPTARTLSDVYFTCNAIYKCGYS